MNLLKVKICIFFAFICVNSLSQNIQGFVYDESNNPIPYAKVYVKNFTNLGGITDEDGKYYFGCERGSYDIIFKCVGFEDQEVKITVENLESTTLNIWMKQKVNELDVVEIKAKKKNNVSERIRTSFEVVKASQNI